MISKAWGIVPLLALAGIQCTTPEDKGAGPDPVPAIMVLSPAKGAMIGTTDTVVIVTRSDYSKFSGGIIITASFDTSKTWFPVRSKGPKTGITEDTVLWYPPDEAADPVVAGAKALLKVTDYKKDLFSETEFFFRN